MATPLAAEHDDYWLERYKAARLAGLTKLEADRFARGSATLQTLRQLKQAGCPAAVLARIIT